MPRVEPQVNKKYSYADYLTWSDDRRWELIDGRAVCMSPAPGRQHQKISGELFSQVHAFLRGKKCEVYAAPFDVRLAETAGTVADDYFDTVVQPDIVIVCDPNKLDERGCNGPPDVIIEILSPSTTRMDMTVKFDIYQRYGVKEYWIVHPKDQTVLVFKLLESGLYGVPERYCAEDVVPVSSLGDLHVELTQVFG